MAQNDLPPKYYLEYFNYVLDFVQEKYRHILNENEWRFLRKYYCLSEDAQCLFIRFSNRRGIFFRVNKLSYSELSDIPALLNELLEAKLTDGEQQLLELESEKLEHAEKITEFAHQALMLVSESDDNIVDRLTFANNL